MLGENLVLLPSEVLLVLLRTQTTSGGSQALGREGSIAAPPLPSRLGKGVSGSFL